MSTSLVFKLEGLDEVIKRLDNIHVRALAARRMKNALMIIEAAAKRGAPSDRGQGRASITSEVEERGSNVIGVVGSPMIIMAYQEFGTGLLAEGPGAKGKRHWPPAAALDVWAQRHGFGKGGGYIVARIIGIRGGLKPLRFFRTAIKDNTQRVINEMKKTLDDIKGVR